MADVELTGFSDATEQQQSLETMEDESLLEETSSEDEYEYEDDPETLWNFYLKGKRIHGTNYTTKAKTTVAQRVTLTEKAAPQRPEVKPMFKESLETNESPKLKEPTSCEEVQVATTAQSWNDKKPKMRTATDVISRILWDPELPAENFTVGYLDRFVGLIEKPFVFFSWEDLASVDYNVLAIPKHRIIYFKYRDTKVWDKNQRLDLVFGSTESETKFRIHEYVQELDDEWELNKRRKVSVSEEDSSEDEIEVRVQRTDLRKELRSLPKTRPNYFVAMRVTNPKIVAKVAEIKDHIRSRDPRYSDFLMKDEALHITMAMLSLEGSEDVERAVEAVSQCRTKLENFFKDPIEVQLQGMGTFNGYVLYVGVKAEKRFYELHSALLEHFRTSGVKLAHEFDFVPHVTIVKLTRSRARLLKNPFVDPYVYTTYKDCDIGRQKCDNLNLCIIGEEKRWDGFYSCEIQIQFKS